VLASHQCARLGSNPGASIICGLILLVLLVLAPRVFSRFSGFPPVEEHQCGDVPLEVPIYYILFILCILGMSRTNYIYAISNSIEKSAFNDK